MLYYYYIFIVKNYSNSINVSIIVILLLLFAVPIIQKYTLAQEVINNEIPSKTNNNDDSPDIDKFAAKPLVHVSITGTEIDEVTVMILFQEKKERILSKVMKEKTR